MLSNVAPDRVDRIRAQFTSAADVWLAVRVFGWALVLPLIKVVVPVKSLARFMSGTRVTRRSRDPLTALPGAPVRDPRTEDRIVTFARWAARVVRPRSGGNCLERGLIAYRYLGAAGANPTLVVGLKRGDTGQVLGHAWVLLDGTPAGESESSVGSYTPMLAFAADGALVEAPDSVSASHRTAPAMGSAR